MLLTTSLRYHAKFGLVAMSSAHVECESVGRKYESTYVVTRWTRQYSNDNRNSTSTEQTSGAEDDNDDDGDRTIFPSNVNLRTSAVVLKYQNRK